MSPLEALLGYPDHLRIIPFAFDLNRLLKNVVRSEKPLCDIQTRQILAQVKIYVFSLNSTFYTMLHISERKVSNSREAE